MAEIIKVSDIDTEYLAHYLRLDEPDQYQLDELSTMLKSAIGYVSSFTGLIVSAPENDPLTTDTDESDVLTLDSKPEFVTAVVVLVQNQYDNRTFYTDKGQVEEVLNSILGLHRTNLL